MQSFFGSSKFASFIQLLLVLSSNLQYISFAFSPPNAPNQIGRRHVCPTALLASPLALDNSLLTLIAFFPTRDREHQSNFVSAFETSLMPIVKNEPGFVSSHIHSSLDGTKVALYEQWKTYNECVKSYGPDSMATAVRTSLKFVLEVADQSVDRRIYEIVASDNNLGGKPVAIDDSYPIVHFAEFRTTEESQPRMVELARENLPIAMQADGLLSATFHRSLDGLRVINYGQWTNVDAIEKLKQQPGFNAEDPYWKGVAGNEHHLYYLESSYEK